jgi:hypothetical protein
MRILKSDTKETKVNRDRFLNWIASVLNANQDRAKMYFNQMQTSSDGI